MNILFIGNSYTFFNQMPEKLFLPMAKEVWGDVEVTSVTRGGWYLCRFADPENEEGKRLREVIAGKHYDCVILQDHSCNPVRDEEGFLQSVGHLKALLSPVADHFVLYSTWGRCDGSPTLTELSLTREEMTDRLNAAYSRAGKLHGMAVAHVGGAFFHYGDAEAVRVLYNPDLSHPSLEGSTLAAGVILGAVVRAMGEK